MKLSWRYLDHWSDESASDTYCVCFASFEENARPEGADKLSIVVFLPRHEGAEHLVVGISALRSGMQFRWQYDLPVNGEDDCEDDEVRYELDECDVPDWNDDPNWKHWVILVENSLDAAVQEAVRRVLEDNDSYR